MIAANQSSLLPTQIHFCEFCLKFFIHKSELLGHMRRCTWKSPPGDEIYRGADGVCMWEVRCSEIPVLRSASVVTFSAPQVDGAKDVEYCQNVSYLAKMVRREKRGRRLAVHGRPPPPTGSSSTTRRSCSRRASSSSTSSLSSTSTATTSWATLGGLPGYRMCKQGHDPLRKAACLMPPPICSKEKYSESGYNLACILALVGGGAFNLFYICGAKLTSRSRLCSLATSARATVAS